MKTDVKISAVIQAVHKLCFSVLSIIFCLARNVLRLILMH